MNKPLQQELWENIRTFAIDDPTSDFPFSKKLQKESNWSSAFTDSAVEEYRKFIFLCCILPNGASPSDAVDKVWHLHLTYTSNYWIEFCRKTLHKEIHHFPSRGGPRDKVKHEDWYRQTLEKYQEVFGYPPPAPIWPPVALKQPAVKVEIYRKDFFNKTVLIFTALTILFIAVTNLFHTKGKDFLAYYFILMVSGILVSWILQEHKSKKLDQMIDEYFPAKFSPFQIASFLYGRHRAYQTALVDLLKRNIISVSGREYQLNTAHFYDPQKEQNPLLPALTENMTAGDRFSYLTGLNLMDTEKLQHPSFAQLTSLSKEIDYQKFIIPGIVLLIGFARLFQGMANEKPVSFLVGEIGIFSLISLMIAAEYSYTQLVIKKSKKLWMKSNNNGQGSDVINNFTLLGVAAIAGFSEYDAAIKIFELEAPSKRSSDSSGDSSTGGCSSGGDSSGGDSGGSSCGGGCGGCGGGD